MTNNSDFDPFTTDGSGRRPLGGSLFASREGFWRVVERRDDVSMVQISNFLARVVLDTVIDDDSGEPRREYTVEARVCGEPPIKFVARAADFDALGWVATHLGARAVIFPGHLARDHIAAAIRLASGKVPLSLCYGHLGWRKVGGRWAFLHAGGTIGAYPAGHGPSVKSGATLDLAIAGPMGPMSEGEESIEVRPDPALENFELPPPPSGDELVSAITSSLLFLEVAPDRVTIPLYGAVWRAAIGHVRFAVHLDGASGTRKTELASVLQRHFGAEMRADRLPANWSSTANALEYIAHLAKDCLLVVDDLFPSTAAEAARLNREADRLIRNAANGAGRGRARPDGTTRKPRGPQCLILSTGEVGLQGKSLNARTVGVELAPGDVDLRILTLLQQEAERGVLAQAMSGFLAWLAPHLDSVRAELAEFVAEKRRVSSGRSHGRTTDQVAEICFSLALFFEFAEQAGAVRRGSFDAFWDRTVRAFDAVGSAQEQRQLATDPVDLYIETLRQAIAMGRAHVAGWDGRSPGESPERWGWVGGLRSADNSEDEPTVVWSSRGNRIGWTDDVHLYLMPGASLAEAKRLCRDTDNSLPISSERVLGRLLASKGLLEQNDENRDKYTVRRNLQGARRNVYMLLASSLMESRTEEHERIPAGTTLDDILEA